MSQHKLSLLPLFLATFPPILIIIEQAAIHLQQEENTPRDQWFRINTRVCITWLSCHTLNGAAAKSAEKMLCLYFKDNSKNSDGSVYKDFSSISVILVCLVFPSSPRNRNYIEQQGKWRKICKITRSNGNFWKPAKNKTKKI